MLDLANKTGTSSISSCTLHSHRVQRTHMDGYVMCRRVVCCWEANSQMAWRAGLYLLINILLYSATHNLPPPLWNRIALLGNFIKGQKYAFRIDAARRRTILLYYSLVLFACTILFYSARNVVNRLAITTSPHLATYTYCYDKFTYIQKYFLNMLGRQLAVFVHWCRVRRHILSVNSWFYVHTFEVLDSYYILISEPRKIPKVPKVKCMYLKLNNLLYIFARFFTKKQRARFLNPTCHWNYLRRRTLFLICTKYKLWTVTHLIL